VAAVIECDKIAQLPAPVDGVEFVISVEFAEEMHRRTKGLEAENAALWAFRQAWRAVQQGATNFDLHHAQIEALGDADEALRQYEDQP
jgi:hypothetical protein